MDPSHAKRYEKSEIEAKAAQVLKDAYPGGVTIPVDIDLLVPFPLTEYRVFLR